MVREGVIIGIILSLLIIMSDLKAQPTTLSRDETEQIRGQVVAEWLSVQAGLLKQNEETHCISQGELHMRYDVKVYGQEPDDGPSLWISMHGGGNAPTALNDSQWENQKRLYQPEEGIYVAPRAPWDDWDMWFKPPIDDMLDELIRTMVALHHVNPNKVYLLGYSAGGDGVWRMAPRMADRWAAASMMAGHPGDVNLLSLRNLPFMIWCGGNDAAYDRNRVNAQRGLEMDSLQQTDPTGFIHQTNILPGKPHWMDLEDKAALPWMAQYRRNPYPSTVIWVQGDRGHKHFYWLGVPEEETKKGAQLRVSVKGNTITIDSEDYTSVTLYLNDNIVNLNKSVIVKWGKRTVFKGRLPRTEENMRKTINLRGDLAYCFPSQVTVKKTAKKAAMVSTHKTQAWKPVKLKREITHPQPMTGLVLWPEAARRLHETYGQAIQLEFSYCLPCKVVTGCREDGAIEYDWRWFDRILEDVASRGHQLIARFRYEYPSNRDVDGQRGTTAVPAYIKQRQDYSETFAENPNSDGPTWYADWSNTELQRFTLQFYTDFARRYDHDPRLAFLEVGFGHWSEYHIYGTKLELGRNFPSKVFQKQFFEHMDSVMTDIPWAVSVDAGDSRYSPVIDDSELMALPFGLFDDSFMHKSHELSSGSGFNERCWNAIGEGIRWQRGVCGGEISYYTPNDQKSFLSPDGLYGHTWAGQAAKYHITFMIANDAPRGEVATPERFREGSLATGYRFVVRQCETNGKATRLRVANEGVAPLYRDAWFAIGNIRSATSLRGLLPGNEIWVEIPAVPRTDGSDVHIVSNHILLHQQIEFAAI